MGESLLEVRLRVEGRVHGVGYRAHCERLARELELTGYAANMPDGSVEALVQGTPKSVQAFVEKIQQGPAPGRPERMVLLASREISPRERRKTFEQTWG
jgi:acylphosphatase